MFKQSPLHVKYLPKGGVEKTHYNADDK